jgi:hypothetical protein
MKYAMLIHYKPGYYEPLCEDEQRPWSQSTQRWRRTPTLGAARSSSRSRPPRRCACATARRC